MIDTALKVLMGVTPILLAILGFYFKIKLKKHEKENKSNELFSKIASMETSIADLKKVLESYISDNIFRISFKNTIRNKSRQLHRLYDNVLSVHSRNAILKWAGLMEKFGLDFFYSEQRKTDEKKRTEYLTSILNSYIDDFYRHVNFSHSGLRLLKSETITISDLLKSANIHSKTEFLKVTLIKNGLSFDDMINLFDDYITEFSQDLSSAFQVWYSLKKV